jgi:DHA2 family multidrug resistance protein
MTMTIGLSALQTVLEEGNKDDWFASPFIQRLAVIALVSLALFVWIELTVEKPLIRLRLLKRRNFGFGTIALTMVGFALFGSVYILPAYLGQAQGYNAQQIGEVLAWTGLPQLLVIPLMPRLMRMVDARWLIAAGFGLFALSNFMNVTISLDVAADQLLLPNIVRAVGQALVLTPLTALSAAGIAPEDKGSASALINVMRNLGGAIGIAVLQTFLTTREYFHFNTLSPSVSPFDEMTRRHIDRLAHHFLNHGVTDPAVAWHKAVAAIGHRIHHQAYTMAFGDTFLLMGVTMIAALVAALLLKKPQAFSAR